MKHNVKVFRFNLFDWWAGYDLASAKSVYFLESGVAKEGGFDEEELPQEAMNIVRIYPNAHAKESRTFEQELTRLVDEGQEFPCYFAGRYNDGGADSHVAAKWEFGHE